MGHMSEDSNKERVGSTAWCPKWEKELSEYINTCERWQKENSKYGKKYGLLQHIEEHKHPWETINMDWVTGLVPGGKESFNACLIIVDSNAMVTFSGPIPMIPTQGPQIPSLISKEDSSGHQSGNPWRLSEDHFRTATTWPCRNWVGNSSRILPRAIYRGY
ncbi:hypothetical protein O181_047289 [Austropuccinia psidii MF-1]|uniref:Integrase zinc-binding domain-containing protein n=1 Tax=Austropuccinia psidii MF-1 TaxID=1389203 RepID=A0A9Q3DQJ1_9BASI|nr:hypothetical protein [Austropuccinia psidii MF-1]